MLVSVLPPPLEPATSGQHQGAEDQRQAHGKSIRRFIFRSFPFSFFEEGFDRGFALPSPLSPPAVVAPEPPAAVNSTPDSVAATELALTVEPCLEPSTVTVSPGWIFFAATFESRVTVAPSPTFTATIVPSDSLT